MTVVGFLKQLVKVHDWDSFVKFFYQQPDEIKVVICLVIFGCVYLVYLFFAALISDKHI